MDRCAVSAQTRKRLFWTTQPNACGEYARCGAACGLPGLVYQTQNDCAGFGRDCGCQCIGPAHDPECLAAYRAAQPSQPLTFATNDWVRSLLLNMFNTYARADASACGNRPGAQGGHWSESYLTDEGITYIGTKMYDTKVTGNIRQAVQLLNAQVAKDAYKLVQLGVAKKVNVLVTYLGQNKVSVAIDVIGPTSVESRVNLSTELISNRWVWS